MDELSPEDKLTVLRARKIQRFLSQAFSVAQVFTGREGKQVPVAETVRSFKEILEGSNTLTLEIVTPAGRVYSENVEMVTLPGVAGQMGIYPQHVSLITQMVPGEMIVRKDGVICSSRRARTHRSHRPPRAI